MLQPLKVAEQQRAEGIRAGIDTIIAYHQYIKDGFRQTTAVKQRLRASGLNQPGGRLITDHGVHLTRGPGVHLLVQRELQQLQFRARQAGFSQYGLEHQG